MILPRHIAIHASGLREQEGDADEETAEDRARQERLDRAHIITRRKQMMSARLGQRRNFSQDL